MPRSTNISTYDATDRALLSLPFIASLADGPKLLRIADEKTAKRTYFRILAVIRAARETGTDIEQLNSFRLGVRAPILVSDEASPTAPPQWAIEFYDRDGSYIADPLADFVRDTCGAIPMPHGVAVSPPEQSPASPLDDAQDNFAAQLRKLGYSPAKPQE